jgi:hypothetical protein
VCVGFLAKDGAGGLKLSTYDLGSGTSTIASSSLSRDGKLFAITANGKRATAPTAIWQLDLVAEGKNDDDDAMKIAYAGSTSLLCSSGNSSDVCVRS